MNKIINEGLESGKTQEEIEKKVEKVVQNYLDDFEEKLVAKIADDWICSICNTKNHKTNKCSNCGNEAGAWKCPVCGNIITGDAEYGAIEKPCSCGFDYAFWEQCHICNEWYNTKKYNNCPKKHK